MKKTSVNRLKKNIVGFFGVLAYLICSFQWLFVVAIYANPIKDLLSSNTPVKVVQAPPVPVEVTGSVPLTVLAAIVTVGIIALSIYVFIRIPKTIATTGRKVVHEVAEQTVPIVLRVQHVQKSEQTPKKVRSIKYRLVVVVKALLIVVPIVLVLCSQFMDKQALDFTVAMYVSLAFAGLTILLFIVQFALARLLRVPRNNVW